MPGTTSAVSPWPPRTLGQSLPGLAEPILYPPPMGRWGLCELRGKNLDKEAPFGFPCPRQGSAAQLLVPTSRGLYPLQGPSMLPTLTLHIRPPRNPSFPITPLPVLILPLGSQTPSQRCPPSLTWEHLSLGQVLDPLGLGQKG